MKYLFELSKEYKDLAKSEILACLKAEKIEYKVIESNQDVLIIQTESSEILIKELAGRLSMSFFVNKFLFSSSLNLADIGKNAEEKVLETPGSVAIKYKNRSENVASKKNCRRVSIYLHKRKISFSKFSR